MKSPAFTSVLRPLRAIQDAHLAEHAARMAAHQRDKTRHEAEAAAWKRKPQGDPPAAPQEPQAIRLIVADTTVEGLMPILQANPRGVLVARDEMSGWVGAFDRYAGGKGADAAHWLSMWGAEQVIVDRKSGTPRTIVVPRAAVSVIGGIQPGTLRRVLGAEHRDSGLMARLLLVMPPRRAKRWTDADVPPEVEASLAGIYDRLLNLRLMETSDGLEPITVRFTPAAKARFKEWYNRHADVQASFTGDLAAAAAKLEAYGARLSMVCHFIRWAACDPSVLDSDQLDEADVCSGTALADWFLHEAQRVYATFTETQDEREQRELIDWIWAKGGRVTVRDLQRNLSRYANDQDRAEADLRALVDTGHARWEVEEPPANGGRQRKWCVLDEHTTQLADPVELQDTDTRPPVAA